MVALPWAVSVASGREASYCMICMVPPPARFTVTVAKASMVMASRQAVPGSSTPVSSTSPSQSSSALLHSSSAGVAWSVALQVTPSPAPLHT